MKQANTILLKKLGQYSALAAPFLSGIGAAHAQVIYHDIDPDVVLGIGDSYSLDLNNDGNVDFMFKVSTYGTSGSLAWDFAGLIPYPASHSNPNGFAGYVNTFGGDPSLYGFPSMFNQSQVIDANLPWKAMPDLIWIESSAERYFYAGMVSNYYGEIFGQWSGAVDNYLALRFTKDGSAALNYAWVRCDVDSDGTTLTIKDFAFEDTPDTPITAGEFTGISNAAASNYNIYGYEGIAHIIVRNGSYQNVKISVTNLAGQIVLDDVLKDDNTTIDLNPYGKGVYVITLTEGDDVFSKKILFR